MKFCKTRKSENRKIIGRGKKEWMLTDTIQHADTKIWKALAGSKHFLFPDYLLALEESKLAGFTFRYVLLFENKKPVAAYYFQLADLSSKDAGSIVNMHQYGKVMQAIASGINDLLLRGKKYSANYLVTCGNMLVTGNHGIACEEKNLSYAIDCLPDIVHSLTEEIEKSNGRVVAVLIKDFPESELAAAASLEKSGFHPLSIDPNMRVIIRPQWKTYEDYLQSLSSKYRLRANNTLENSGGLTIKEFRAEDIESHAAEIENLYTQVVNKAPVLIVRASASFFISMKKRLKEHYRFRAILKKGKLIAFTTGYYYDSLDAHFIGIDYSLTKENSLYLFILYDFVKCAINERKKELIYGRTAIEIKSTVGASPVELMAYLKINSVILHRVVGAVLPFFKNDKYIIRNPFKELKD